MNLSSLEQNAINGGATFETFWSNFASTHNLTDPDMPIYLYQATAFLIERILTSNDYLDVRQALKLHLS